MLPWPKACVEESCECRRGGGVMVGLRVPVKVEQLRKEGRKKKAKKKKRNDAVIFK
jgi:hypothetical protein